MAIISKRDILRLTEGEIPKALSFRPFIVMRKSVTVRGLTETSWQWEISTSPDDSDSCPIDRLTALSIIRNNEMILAHSEKAGQIYEMPGKPFYEMYNRRKAKSSLAS